MTTSTPVAIIGAGPAGTLLALILRLRGIESTVLERQSREHVLGRVRAGVLESTSVDVLREAGLAGRLDAEGQVHGWVKIGWRGDQTLIVDFLDLAGKPMIAYGQTMLQEDLYAAADDAGIGIVFECDDVAIHDADTDRPWVGYRVAGEELRVDCDVVAGCDGFHGVSRPSIPPGVLTEYEKAYPFGWLGILSETPPLPDLVYANHERGFALCSQRNEMLSRYYVQCSLDDTVDDWSDDRFWHELLTRVPREEADRIVTGPSIEKSIAPLRSFVAEPMRWGRILLAGDAAHIVPPTGAKGLNLAISDVHYLAEAISAHLAGDPDGLDGYSDRALARVWGSVRFSWWMTMLLHRFPDQSAFDQRAQEEDLRYLRSSVAARTMVAEQYVGRDL